MRDFADKVVVITGAGAGMGLAYVEAFAREGARLALNDVDTGAVEGARTRALELGAPAAIAWAFDVSSRDAMMGFAAAVRDELVPAHVIINNAGIEGETRPAWKISDASYERVIGVNLWGVIHGTRAFLPQLFENGEGAVVNISSAFGLIAPPGFSDYAASKFAVRGFTEALMAELHGRPIGVHLVHPGGIDTDIAKNPRSSPRAKKLLTTPPADVATAVIAGIRRGSPRIVCGNGGRELQVAGTLVPLRLRLPILRRTMR